MLRLSDTLRSFSPPDLTPEQWEANDREVMAWEVENAERRRESRMARSGIPEMLRGADISLCDQRVRDYASGDLGRGLLLQGSFGSGKTYAACAVLIAKAYETSVRFALMDDLLRECRATFSGWDTEEAVIGRYASAGVLCLDDLGKERLTEWSLPILFTIVNRRYEGGFPTIVTTNYRGADLLRSMTVNGDATTAKAIISRMSAYRRIELAGGDRRIRWEA